MRLFATPVRDLLHGGLKCLSPSLTIVLSRSPGKPLRRSRPTVPCERYLRFLQEEPGAYSTSRLCAPCAGFPFQLASFHPSGR